MKPMQKLVRSLKRIPAVILSPARYFSEEKETWLDGILAVVLLFIATTLQKLAWRQVPGQSLTFGQAAQAAALNTLMAWTGFFAIYYLVMVISKKKTDLPELLGAAGVAGLPVALLTFISALSWWVGGFFGLDAIMPAWIMAQNVLAWIGLALGWPGWMAYYVFRYRLELPGKWPVFLPILLLAGLMAAWLVTVL
jgi:hypothetical protein